MRHLLLALALTSSPALAQTEVTAPGPQGPLAGTMLGDGKGPVVLMVPGSGPTDRDGNNPLAVAGAPYKRLAEALAAGGVTTVRVDKRGMFGSKAAIPDANAVTIADYAADVHGWAKVLRARTGARCVWVLGHSEGGLVALQAAQRPADLCGVILLSSPGRPAGAIMHDQLAANPANAPLMGQIDTLFAAYAAGRPIDRARLDPAIAQSFPPQLDGYMASLLSTDPARLISAYPGPVLIEQGTRDLQVSVADAKSLAAAQPRARLELVPDTNHVLRHVASDDRAANLATYADASAPLADGVVGPILSFLRAAR